MDIYLHTDDTDVVEHTVDHGSPATRWDPGEPGGDTVTLEGAIVTEDGDVVGGYSATVGRNDGSEADVVELLAWDCFGFAWADPWELLDEDAEAGLFIEFAAEVTRDRV